MRFITAAGRASEVRTALRLGVEWGYFAPLDADPVHALLKRILNMLWKLTH